MILIAVLAYLVVRLVFLYYIHPLFSLLGTEELFRGTIGWELWHHSVIPWVMWRADDYGGGSLVVGKLASWIFPVLGSTAIALKLIPTLFSAAGLAFWMLLIQRSGDRRMAGYFAILYIIAPPLWMRYSTTAMGFHSESCFFTALTLFLFFELWQGRRSSWVIYLLLGIVAGFGCWFTYIYAVTWVALACFVAWQGKNKLQAQGLIMLGVGFVLGFSPWINNALMHHVQAWRIGDGTVWGHFSLREGLSSFHHWDKSFLFLWATSFSSDDWFLVGWGKPNLVYSLWLLLLVAAVTLTRSGHFFRTSHSELMQMAASFIVVLTVFLIFSDFKTIRYRVVFLPFVFCLIAGGIRTLEEKSPRWGRGLVYGFMGSFVLLGLAYNQAFCSPLYAGRLWHTPGYTFIYTPPTPCASVDTCQDYYAAVAPGLSPTDRSDLAAGVSESIAEYLSPYDPTALFTREWPAHSPLYDRLFYYRLGRLLRLSNALDYAKAARVIEQWGQRHPEFIDAAMTGLGSSLEYEPYFPTPERVALENVVRTLPPREARSSWRGLGYEQAHDWYRDSPDDLFLHHLQTALTKLPPPARPFFIQGVGLFLFDRWNDSPLHPHFAPENLEDWPAEISPFLFQGMGIGWMRLSIGLFSDERQWHPLLLSNRLNVPARTWFDQGAQQFAEDSGMEHSFI